MRGLVHVYTGDGKGKTTAALGMALRAAGHGLHTYIGQFMKGQEYGELAAPALLGNDAAGRPLLTIEQHGKPTFLRAEQVSEQDRRQARKGLARTGAAMRSGAYELVVLDEVNVALHFALLSADEVLHLIEAKPAEVELILTGRRAPEAILERADYVTVMQQVKHPYEHGVQARAGIEF
jgi:cob(I)alamin adenosyltransferase